MQIDLGAQGIIGEVTEEGCYITITPVGEKWITFNHLYGKNEGNHKIGWRVRIEYRGLDWAVGDAHAWTLSGAIKKAYADYVDKRKKAKERRPRSMEAGLRARQGQDKERMRRVDQDVLRELEEPPPTPKRRRLQTRRR